MPFIIILLFVNIFYSFHALSSKFEIIEYNIRKAKWKGTTIIIYRPKSAKPGHRMLRQPSAIDSKEED